MGSNSSTGSSEFQSLFWWIRFQRLNTDSYNHRRWGFQSLFWWIRFQRKRTQYIAGLTGVFQSLFWWIRFQRLWPLKMNGLILSCFNPCSGGSGSRGRKGISLAAGDEGVSILVLVDQVPEALGQSDSCRTLKQFQSLFWWIRFQRLIPMINLVRNIDVSILVLVDQVPEDKPDSFIFTGVGVSILVLVDQVPEAH